MLLARFLKDRTGATAVEYGVITAIMAVALLSGYGAFSNAMNKQFLYLSNTITDSWPE